MNKFIPYMITNSEAILRALLEHTLYLVLIPVMTAVVLAVPLGILCTKKERLGKVMMGIIGVFQTIPSLALLAFMITLGFGIGYRPAIIALVIYSLLPIARNTYTGIKGVDPAIMEASLGMGMTRFQQLIHIEIPLTVPVILAGVRTAAVMSVGSGTLAAMVGAGGLGQFIVTGLSQVRDYIILAGALPSALLALAVDGILGWVEFLLTPKGIRKTKE